MATHNTVRAAGGGDYTTIGAAVAATTSGTGPSDFSTITILDSSTYAESVDFTGLEHVRLTCAAGETPTIEDDNYPVIVGAGADHIEVEGADAESPITLSLQASGSNQRCLYVTDLAASWKTRFVTFNMAGTSGYGVQCVAGDSTGTWTIHDCGISGNAFTGFLISAAATLDVQRNDFTGATLSSWWGQINTLNASTISRNKFSTPIIIRTSGAFGVIHAGKLTFTNNICVSSGTSEPFLQLWDGSPFGGNPPNADVWNNTFQRSGAAGTSVAVGVTGTVANVDITNNGFVGFDCGVTSANALTITNNGFWECDDAVGAGVTNTDPQIGDPLLTDFRPGVGSAWLDVGATLAGVTEDFDGTARPKFGGVGLLYDIGPFELDLTPPDLLSAGADSSTQVTAVFSEAVSGADLTDVLAWTLEPVAGGSALAIEEITCTDGINAVLTLADISPLQSGTYYRLTCPDNVTNGEGVTIDNTEAEFRAPVWPEEITPWTPPGARFSLDGVALEYLPLLPEDGEPTGATLLRAAWLSLLCHRRAGPDVTLPDPWADPPYRGGWYGDTFATVAGDLWGSLLWTLYRYRGPNAPARAEEAVRDALAWMVADGLAASVACTATRSGSYLDLEITIRKGKATAALGFDLWGGL